MAKSQDSQVPLAPSRKRPSASAHGGREPDLAPEDAASAQKPLSGMRLLLHCSIPALQPRHAFMAKRLQSLGAEGVLGPEKLSNLTHIVIGINRYSASELSSETASKDAAQQASDTSSAPSSTRPSGSGTLAKRAHSKHIRSPSQKTSQAIEVESSMPVSAILAAVRRSKQSGAQVPLLVSPEWLEEVLRSGSRVDETLYVSVLDTGYGGATSSSSSSMKGYKGK